MYKSVVSELDYPLKNGWDFGHTVFGKCKSIGDSCGTFQSKWKGILNIPVLICNVIT